MEAAVCGGKACSLRLVLSLAFVLCLSAPRLLAQEPDSCAAQSACPESVEASPDAQQAAQPAGASTAPSDSAQSATEPAGQNFAEPGPKLEQKPPLPGQEPKRILGIMPNFRAVSAGATPPPPTPSESFVIATRNSFDYSAFVFVGITSLLAEANDSHPQLGEGIDGFAKYYWRGWVGGQDGRQLLGYLCAAHPIPSG